MAAIPQAMTPLLQAAGPPLRRRDGKVICSAADAPVVTLATLVLRQRTGSGIRPFFHRLATPTPKRAVAEHTSPGYEPPVTIMCRRSRAHFGHVAAVPARS